MAENNKLYITITDSRGQGNGDGTTPTPNNQKQLEQSNNLASRYAEHEMQHFVKNTINKSVNFAVSNVGNFTGNYIAQAKVNETKQAVTSLMALATSAFAGFSMSGGNIFGAAAGFLAGAESMLFSATLDVVEREVEYAKTNYDIEQLRARVGLNTTKDGSRGTEN